MNSYSCTSNVTVTSDELLKSQSLVWNHILNFINSMSLKCAVQMKIPDIIHNHGKPMTLEDLFSALPVHRNKSQHLYRLMRVLVHSGFFAMHQVCEANDDKQGYVLTSLGYSLLSDHPMSVVPYLYGVIGSSIVKPWVCMSTWFKTDDASLLETVYGKSYYKGIEVDQKLSEQFNETLMNDSLLVASILLDKCAYIFEELKSLVDVGGSTGTMAYAIANAFPDLICTNFDLPHVINGLEGTANVKHVHGDMFESIPQASGILLKWILHNWSDEDCVKILKNCKEAIVKENGGKGGKLIIIDMVVGTNGIKTEDIEAIETQLLFDLLMMTMLSGKERVEKEWADIFEKSGFNTYKIINVLGLRSVIEVFL